MAVRDSGNSEGGKVILDFQCFLLIPSFQWLSVVECGSHRLAGSQGRKRTKEIHNSVGRHGQLPPLGVRVLLLTLKGLFLSCYKDPVGEEVEDQSKHSEELPYKKINREVMLSKTVGTKELLLQPILSLLYLLVDVE